MVPSASRYVDSIRLCDRFLLRGLSSSPTLPFFLFLLQFLALEYSLRAQVRKRKWTLERLVFPKSISRTCRFVAVDRRSWVLRGLLSTHVPRDYAHADELVSPSHRSFMSISGAYARTSHS